MALDTPATATETALSPVGPTLETEYARLRTENYLLKADAGYWKKMHAKAKEREEVLTKEIQQLKARIRYYIQQLYERKTEQGTTTSEQTFPASEPTAETAANSGCTRHRGQQRGAPGHPRRTHQDLPAEDEDYDLGEAEKYCPHCGLPLIAMPDTEDSMLVETQEVRGYRRLIHRRKYRPGCQCPGHKGIITAPGPAKLMPGSIYGLSVWVHILVRKYHFQIPVARILANLSLHGVDIPAGSVGDGIKRLTPLFEPIYKALEERSRMDTWWQADETRWRVFELTESKQTFNWYLWVFMSSQAVVYVIDPSRSAQVIEDHLGTVVNGILLVDRYAAYKLFASRHSGILLAFCWAHVRRDFRNAGLTYPQMADWAERWVERINQVVHQNNLRIQYPVGSAAFAAADQLLRAGIAALRQELETQLGMERPHPEQLKALKSLHNHWSGLTVFVDHPEIPMDNNGSERQLRPPVLGRKAYAGSGSVWSGRLSAMLFSIFETLKLWDINPVRWLSDYFNACAVHGGQAPADITTHLPWHIQARKERTWTFCGRAFSATEIDGIKALIDADTSRNRTTIARLCCEQLAWKKPDGTWKLQSMTQALRRMAAQALLTLPEPTRQRVVHRQSGQYSSHSDPEHPLSLCVDAQSDITFRMTATAEDLQLWSEYLERYHYLGYTILTGAQLRYFVSVGSRLVALLGFGAAAWRIAPRDWTIGWTDEQRKQQLHLVVNNARFLILPWITAPNLASMILGRIAARIGDDWEARYHYRPVLLETFVETRRFDGTCYKAANWQWVGTTKGRGRKRRTDGIILPTKEILLYPLVKGYKKILCSGCNGDG